MLNARQKAFCEYYVASCNATESAIKAGYSEKTAYSIGNENLKKPEIQNYIKSLTEQTKSKRIMSAKERKEWLTTVIKNENEKLNDRLKALDILNKMEGEYIEKVQVNGEINNPLANLTTEEIKKLI